MPIYEFECPSCGAVFEELVSGDNAPACPKCHAEKSVKLLSCACFRSAAPKQGNGSPYSPPQTYTASGGGCGGCSGGNCSSCH